MSETISIITACYNSSSTIGACLDSIRRQSRPCESIVVDGGSTDGTLEEIGRSVPERFTLISEPDRGMYDALNKGIRRATGDVIGVLHADDIYSGPDVLCRASEVFAKGSVDSCYGDLVYVDREDICKVIRYWRSGRYDVRRFSFGWMPPHPTFFVRRSVYEKYGLFNLALGSAADYELMLRFLVRYKVSTAYIPEVLVKMRTGGTSNSSLKNRLAAHRNDRLAWKVNGLKPYPWTLPMKPLRKIGQYIARP